MRRLCGFIITLTWGLLYVALAAAGCAIGLSAAALVLNEPASSQGEAFASRFDGEAMAIDAVREIVPEVASPQPLFPAQRLAADPDPPAQAKTPKASDGPRLALRYGLVELVPASFTQWASDEAALLRANLETTARDAVELP